MSERIENREMEIHEMSEKGFETYKRTDHDEEGGAYPLLYMRLSKSKR